MDSDDVSYLAEIATEAVARLQGLFSGVVDAVDAIETIASDERLWDAWDRIRQEAVDGGAYLLDDELSLLDGVDLPPEARELLGVFFNAASNDDPENSLDDVSAQQVRDLLRNLADEIRRARGIVRRGLFHRAVLVVGGIAIAGVDAAANPAQPLAWFSIKVGLRATAAGATGRRFRLLPW